MSRTGHHRGYLIIAFSAALPRHHFVQPWGALFVVGWVARLYNGSSRGWDGRRPCLDTYPGPASMDEKKAKRHSPFKVCILGGRRKACVGSRLPAGALRGSACPSDEGTSTYQQLRIENEVVSFESGAIFSFTDIRHAESRP